MSIKSKKSVYIKPDYLKTQTQIITPASQVSEPDQITVFAIDSDTEIVSDTYQQPAGQSKPDMMENNGTIDSIKIPKINRKSDIRKKYVDENGIVHYVLYDINGNILLEDYDDDAQIPPLIPHQLGDPISSEISTYEGLIGLSDLKKKSKRKTQDSVKYSKAEIKNVNDLSIMNESMTNTIDNFLSKGSTKNYLMVAFIIAIVGIMIYKS